MIWFWYALASALIIAIITVLQKQVLREEHATEFVVALSILNALFSLPLFFTIDYQTLSIPPLLIIIGASIIATVSQILNARSLRHMDISTASPLYTTAPAVTAILAFFILGEQLSTFQVCGIVVIIIGTYLLELKKKDPLSVSVKLIHSKYFYFIVISIFLFGINALLSRYLLTHYRLAPQVLVAFSHIFLSILLSSYFFIRYDGYRGIANSFKKYGSILILISILTIGYRLLEIRSLQLAAATGIVIAVVKSSSLFTTIIGGRLFKEKNLGIKTLSCIIIIAGIFLVILT
jgi:bacterial/archaeal transporter family protein